MLLAKFLPSVLLLLSPTFTCAHILPSSLSLGGVKIVSTLRQDEGYNNRLRREADQIIDGYLVRRQQDAQDSTPTPSSSVDTSSPSTTPNSIAPPTKSSTPGPLAISPVDPAKWEVETRAACMSSLRALNGTVLSASGLAVCYNIPFLNNVTGVFQADLRLYRVAQPSAAWADVRDAEINVDLSYVGASFSMSGSNDATSAFPKLRRSLETRAASPTVQMPVFVQGFNFIGKMNAELLSVPLNLSQLRTYLAPTVLLETPNPTDLSSPERLKSTLSPKDASFVNGLLSQGTSTTCSTLMCMPSPAEAAARRSSAYQMPGTKFEIFPTGLIITSTWAFLGICVVAWGTVGRLRFRQQYRRRCARAIAGRPRKTS